MRTLVAVIWMILAAGAAQGGYAVPATVTVDREELTLADLVPEAPAGWEAVALGRAPRPLGERVLDRQWLLRRASQVGAESELQIPARVVVRRPGQEVARDRVVEAVEAALRDRVGPHEQLRVASVGLPGPVPEGALQLRVRLPEGPIPSPATLWVDVFRGDDPVGRAWARVEVFRGRPILTLVRSLRRGDVVTALDVEVRAGEAVREALVDPAEAVGKRLVRSLRAGTALTARDLEVVPVIGRGDGVRLVARVGGVVASLPGRALEPAGIGETLRVENLSSGKTVSGVLREGGVVDVIPARGGERR
ncbi:MAG: hypothetical protein Kow0092_14460 [Deferrisomatales bacterium]